MTDIGTQGEPYVIEPVESPVPGKETPAPAEPERLPDATPEREPDLVPA